MTLTDHGSAPPIAESLDAESLAAMLGAVDDFATRRLAPNAAEWDATHHFPLDALAEAGEVGLGALYVREDVGGMGLSRADGVRIFERLARGDTSIAAYVSIHNMVVWMIDTFGTDAQREQWIPGLADLGQRASYCLTEPEAGSDAAALRTRATRTDGGWRLDGVKQFISGAGSSDVYLVMARTGDGSADGVSAFLVPGDAAGLSFGANERKMGWNAQPTRQVVLDGVELPAANLIGGEAGEGQGFRIAMRGLNGGRLGIAACSLGGAQWAVDTAATYIGERRAFGKPIAAFQGVLFPLADAQVDLQAARCLLLDAATKLDRHSDEAPVACAGAKRFVTEASSKAADTALQALGGYGYLSEFGIEKVVRDLRVHQILEGTSEVMRLLVGRSLVAGMSGSGA